MHIQQSPSCFKFVRRQIQHKTATSTASDQTFVTSSKQASLLRNNVVNSHLFLPPSLFSAVPVPSLPNSYSGDEEFLHSNDDDESNNCYILHSKNDTADDGTNVLPKRHKAFESQFMFTNDQKWTIALLKILDDMNAPDYAFSEIIKWAQAANTDDYSFDPDSGFSPLRNIDILFKSVHNADRLLPSVVAVPLPHGPTSDVITFEFAPQLLNLFQDVTIMTPENLLLDLENPLAPYASPNGELSDAISGSVYRNAYKRLITNPQRRLFVPIIQWIDRTSVTGNDRFSLKPHMFTPTIFKETFQQTMHGVIMGFYQKPNLLRLKKLKIK